MPVDWRQASAGGIGSASSNTLGTPDQVIDCGKRTVWHGTRLSDRWAARQVPARCPFSGCPLAISFLSASIMVSRHPARGWQMPFDNPHQTPFGDLELLMEARGRISSRDTWVQGHFQKRGRYCLVASLSLTCGSRSFGMPNRTELRLSRLVAMHMPSNAPFWIRHRFMPARRRLIAFNDDLLTHHEDVIALLDRAIEHLASTAPVCVAA